MCSGCPRSAHNAVDLDAHPCLHAIRVAPWPPSAHGGATMTEAREAKVMSATSPGPIILRLPPRSIAKAVSSPGLVLVSHSPLPAPPPLPWPSRRAFGACSPLAPLGHALPMASRAACSSSGPSM